MTTYSSYEAAKIANPDSDIFTKAGKFIGECDLGPSPHTYECRGIAKCKPADHCMTVEKFLADGYKFVEGDLILDEGVIWTVSDKVNSDTYIYTVKSSNKPDVGDNNRYILRAAALEEKKIRTKVEWIDVHHSEAVYCFTKTNDDMYAEPDESQKYDDLQDYINNLEESGSSSLYRRIETPMTEREAFIDGYESLCAEFTQDDTKKADDWAGYVFDKLVN